MLSSCSPPVDRAAAPSELMIGVKIYQHDGSFEELLSQWAELGINTAFVSETLAADTGFRDLAAEQGVDVFIIAPVFFNPEALEQDPDLIALTADGEQARDDWVEFVCPSRPGYRQRRRAEIAEMARRLRPQGISLDFIRHFVFWEMVHPETAAGSLPVTCFCPHCLSRFAEEMEVEIPQIPGGTRETAEWVLSHHPDRWTEWRIGLVSSMVEEIVAEVARVDPAIEINIHAVPWRRQDYDGAIRRVAGQDFTALSAFTDYLSPMCYSFMLKRPPEWVHMVVRDLADASDAKIVPSIQVREAYREERFEAAEFEGALREALRPPSRGVVFWSWEALAEEPEKRRIVREVVAGSAGPARPG